VVSKRRSAPYRSYRPGECPGLAQGKMVTRREANRERKALKRLLHCDRDVRVGSRTAVNHSEIQADFRSALPPYKETSFDLSSVATLIG
jgi:hypothetical protein